MFPKGCATLLKELGKKNAHTLGNIQSLLRVVRGNDTDKSAAGTGL